MKTSILSQIKNLLVLCGCVASLASVKAQTFSILPANTQTVTLTCDSMEVVNNTQIYNPTDKDLFLSYKIISNTLPSSSLWDYTFCDWQLCYIGLPPSQKDVSDTIKPHTQNEEMVFHIVSNKNKGSGSFVLKIYETINPSNFQMVTWNVNGCTAAGISETTLNTDFIVYPNPSQDFVNVKITTGYSSSGSIQVYNLVGEKLVELNGIKNSIQRIDLKELPAGAYFVKYSTGEGASVKKIFKTE